VTILILSLKSFSVIPIRDEFTFIEGFKGGTEGGGDEAAAELTGGTGAAELPAGGTGAAAELTETAAELTGAAAELAELAGAAGAAGTAELPETDGATELAELPEMDGAAESTAELPELTELPEMAGTAEVPGAGLAPFVGAPPLSLLDFRGDLVTFPPPDIGCIFPCPSGSILIFGLYPCILKKEPKFLLLRVLRWSPVVRR